MPKIVIILIAVILNSANVFAADISLNDDSLPVHVRHHAHRFFEETHDLFLTKASLAQENSYKLFFKGLIYGEAFGVLADTNNLLKTALKDLVSTDELQSTKKCFLVADLIKSDAKAPNNLRNRRTQRNQFKKAFNKTLENLYKEGNIYAIFVKGFLGYDNATDGDDEIHQSLAELELAAHHLCLPALKFCKKFYNDQRQDSAVYDAKKDAITITKTGKSKRIMKYEHPEFFNPQQYVFELIKKPFGHPHYLDLRNSLSKLTRKKDHVSLPVVDTIEHIKRSILLTKPEFEENYTKIFDQLNGFARDRRRSFLLLGGWGKTSLLGSPIAGLLTGAVGIHNGDIHTLAGKMLVATTLFVLPPLLYTAQQSMAAPLVCYGSDSYINHEIGLLSLYLTFQKDTLSQIQVSQKIELAKDGLLLGLEDSFTEKFSRFLRQDTLTLSQVFLAKEEKKQEEIAL